MRYQDPILLAEAAATPDLLVGGRLRLALATGSTALWDPVFGAVDTDPRTEARRRLERFLSAVEGAALHTVDGPGQGAPVGTAVRVTPHRCGWRPRVPVEYWNRSSRRSCPRARRSAPSTTARPTRSRPPCWPTRA